MLQSAFRQNATAGNKRNDCTWRQAPCLTWHISASTLRGNSLQPKSSKCEKVVTAIFASIAALVVIYWLAQQIWGTVRSYRRERQWDELAQKGDATASIIVQLRDKQVRW